MNGPAGAENGRHPSLRRGPADLIDGEWLELAGRGGGNGPAVASFNPARPNDGPLWAGAPEPRHVDAAVAAARRALPAWSRWGLENRFAALRAFRNGCAARQGEIAALIRDETGKAMWEARGEAAILGSKVDTTLDESPVGGLRRVAPFEFPMTPTRAGECRFRPHGVMAVVGPFNFPAHLPNGHIVPALAMGNTVVFKPSDKAPAVGQLLGELFQEALESAGAPGGGAGIVNVVQGAAPTASALVAHDGLDGVLFTGSWPVGRKILEANLDRPGRIVALELGGNNAAVVMPDADLRQAAIEIVRCAFNTTGQRCTSTRRAIVHRAVADRLLPALVQAAEALILGDPRAEGVFMGPIITGEQRAAVLQFQAELAGGGAEVLLESHAPPSLCAEHGGWYITPGIARVDRFTRDEGAGPGRDTGCDVEVFGPLLRVSVVEGLDEAIEQANATRYGLAASIFTRDADAQRRFADEARAGCVNINTGTAGASSKLPFGGVGHSGNHRPAGSFALDYCAYPVAGMVESGAAATLAEGMRFDDAWLR